MKLKLPYIFFLIFILLSVPALAYNEAPVLKEQVNEGDLPEVEERLPENPMEIETVNETGEYGGTWERLTTAEDFLFMSMTLDGASFLKFSEEDLEPEPHLVSDWEVNDEKSEWIFEFRKGVKWSDGEPFTVDDFLFWWEDMVLNEEHSFAPLSWMRVEGELMEVTKIDDYTVSLEFAGPNPFLLDYLAMWSSQENTGMQIYPSHYLKDFHPDYSDDHDNFEEFEEKQNWWENEEVPVLTAWRPVERDAGNRLVMERNPYYYAVDNEGNQLPYIDEIEVEYVADNEVFKLQSSEGNVGMQIRPNVMGVRDISLLRSKEEENNYTTLLWNSGSGTGPIFMPNRNHPDSEKQELYKNPKFLRALSHAIDREKLLKSVFYDQGYITTGTYSEKTPFFQTDTGQELFKEWRDLAVEYDTEKSKELLDEIEVIDQNDDGWRELPNGDELTLRIDIDSETDNTNMDTTEYAKEFWEEIGLKTVINTMDGSQLWIDRVNAEFDIMGGWEASDGSSIVGQPGWMAPVDPDHHWAPLYDRWYLEEGIAEEDDEIEENPRELSPPRQRPESGSPMDKLQRLYDEAKRLPTEEERRPLVEEMIEIHLENGPFYIGTVAGYPRIGVKSNTFKNVPEELNAGWINDWHLSYIATLNPEQFYIEE